MREIHALPPDLTSLPAITRASFTRNPDKIAVLQQLQDLAFSLLFCQVNMHSYTQNIGTLKPLIPKKPLRAVNFICTDTMARSVHLVGDFNHWNPLSHPMRRQPDGAWLLQVELSHGYHQYMFLVDGQMRLDPRAQGKSRSKQGEMVSMVGVSGY